VRFNMGGGGGSQKSTTTTSIDPAIKPYVTYGLEEAKRLYETGSPQFFPGQTYVSPSAQTQEALRMAQERAMAGSPLTGAAQAETLATIQGRGVNPFLAGALEQTNRLSGEDYLRNMQKLQSGASSMGRYGSGAQNQLTGQAQDVYARALTEQGGQLAYQSAEAERNRQMAAVGAAPQMAQADYADIQRLLTVGGAKEAQSAAQLQDEMNRFNFAQNLPQAKLSQYANLYSSAPQGSQTVQTATPTGGK
jgi:hypothetical protein